jgi:hypothetical protein
MPRFTCALPAVSMSQARNTASFVLALRIFTCITVLLAYDSLDIGFKTIPT